MVATYRVETENREIYFFREGSVVFWNVPEIERDNVLRFLKKYETGRYDEEAVEEECESLTYAYSDLPWVNFMHEPSRCKILTPKGKFETPENAHLILCIK